MITYIKLWWGWATRCRNSWSYKIAVLFKLTKSPSFEFHKGYFEEVEK